MIAPMIRRSAVAPSGPTDGNRLLANDAPVATETNAANSASRASVSTRMGAGREAKAVIHGLTGKGGIAAKLPAHFDKGARF